MKTINQLTSDKGMHNEAFLEEVKNYGIDKMSQTDFHQNLANFIVITSIQFSNNGIGAIYKTDCFCR